MVRGYSVCIFSIDIDTFCFAISAIILSMEASLIQMDSY